MMVRIFFSHALFLWEGGGLSGFFLFLCVSPLFFFFCSSFLLLLPHPLFSPLASFFFWDSPRELLPCVSEKRLVGCLL